LWDTHRALHPLLNIIDKKRSHDFVITFLKQFEQSGRLPMWELWNNETDCMIGFHSVSVILDAYRKLVISKEELKQLWPAVKAEAMSNRFGLDKFREKGYLSVEDESESASKTAEYSYDMWCVSEIASELNLKEDEKYFRKYKDAWCELRNTETGFLQPRKNGNWLQNFNPYEVNNNYTEANGWQYSFYHPQNGKINEQMIDSLFKASSKTQGRTQADITGLIGQYAHGNEPSHNYIYLLNNKNRFKYLKYVFDNFYTIKPDGLIGNEDCGQMSAWYVMSALGFYQICPGKNWLTAGLPLFEKITINLQNNKKISIENKLKNLENSFEIDIKGKADNFRSYDNYGGYDCDNKTINFERIQRDKDDIRITFSEESFPVPTCGEGESELDRFMALSPIITSVIKKPFIDSIPVKINPHYFSLIGMRNFITNPISYYSVNGSAYSEFKDSFFIKENSVIKAYSVFTFTYGNDTSNLSTAHFYKRPHNYSIQLNCKYNRQYTADGDDGIIDGQYGEIEWRKGGWQGYQAQDFEAIIDMKEMKQFAEISANFLQDTRAWILFPTKVEFYTSDDSINFKLAETIENTISPQDYNIQTQKLKVKTTKEFSTARYIKVKAYNYGKLPEWHAGKGDDAFIFIDEIDIK